MGEVRGRRSGLDLVEDLGDEGDEQIEGGKAGVLGRGELSALGAEGDEEAAEVGGRGGLDRGLNESKEGVEPGR